MVLRWKKLEFDLKRALQTIKEEHDSPLSFIPLSRSWYFKKWDELDDGGLKKYPEFSCEGVSIKGYAMSVFNDHFIRVQADFGNKERNTFILTSIRLIHKSKVALAFCSLFSNWPSMRLVTSSLNGRTLYRNDFMTVKRLREEDMRLGRYLKVEKRSSNTRRKKNFS